MYEMNVIYNAMDLYVFNNHAVISIKAIISMGYVNFHVLRYYFNILLCFHPSRSTGNISAKG